MPCFTVRSLLLLQQVVHEQHSQNAQSPLHQHSISGPSVSIWQIYSCQTSSGAVTRLARVEARCVVYFEQLEMAWQAIEVARNRSSSWIHFIFRESYGGCEWCAEDQYRGNDCDLWSDEERGLSSIDAAGRTLLSYEVWLTINWRQWCSWRRWVSAHSITSLEVMYRLDMFCSFTRYCTLESPNYHQIDWIDILQHRSILLVMYAAGFSHDA